ncbi:MAG TPA: acyltransferase [Edaphobacter sp.]|jgi:peptidoglycan/LPS O-acetylase OafA/YrhL|nr:acyltransferase [Edaphobacter sp.]
MAVDLPAPVFRPIDFKTRLPALDGIRALAITLVFFEHYGGGSHGGFILRVLGEARKRGWVGVDLFFVLSGFLITGILYDTRNDSHFFKRFYARRSVRIFPIFYLLAIILLVITPIFQYQWHWLHLTFLVYLGNFFANYDFSLYDIVSRNHPTARLFIGHLWSLCVEEQFYLIWPLAVWAIRDRIRLIWTAAGLSLVALALRCVMCMHFSPELSEQWIMRTLPFRMDSLLFGGILALLLRGPAADRYQRMSRSVFLAASAGVLAIFALSPAYDSPWLLTIGLTLIAAASAGLIGATVKTGSFEFRFFSPKPLLTLGKYSYGFYVYHLLYRWAWIQFLVFLGKKTHSIALAGIIELTSVFVVTFIVSKLSYDLFEVRFLRYKKKFEYDSEIRTHQTNFEAELKV